MRFTLLFMLVLIICSCEPQRTQEPPVAQVFESTLSRSEIIDFIPNGTSSEDSLLMAQNYIRNWVTQKLLLHKAIENLSNEEMNIQKQVEDYRTSLLIYQYKQKLIAQRLMDEISEEDIETYYNKNEKNFILPTPIIEKEMNESRRYKLNVEKIATGDVNKIAEVVRDLAQRDVDEHGLSAGEKRMLTKARSILTSEISLSEHLDEAEAQRLLDVNLGYEPAQPGDEEHHTEAPEEAAMDTLARVEAESKKSKKR